jgi:hypothetical protein
VHVVAGAGGHLHLVIERADDRVRVRSVSSGEERWVHRETLKRPDGSVLELAGRQTPFTSADLPGVHTEAGVGMVVLLARNGPTAVPALLGALELCESDLHGLLAELEAGGALSRTETAGRGAYRLTDAAAKTVDGSN